MLKHEDVAFYAGLVITIIGLLVWVARPSSAPGKSEIEFLGLKFSFDAPALAVMVIGIMLTVLSPNFHVEASPPPPPFKRIVCYADHESECAEHEIFMSCRNKPSSGADIAKVICGSAKSGYSILKSRDTEGEPCHAYLIEVTCNPPGT